MIDIKAMDKRTIIFVLLVGATFLGLNLFFGYQRDEKNRELLKTQEMLAKTAPKEISNLEQRRAQVSELPIVALFADQEQNSSLGYGVAVDEGTLALAWSETLPSKIYVNGQQQTLITPQSVKGGAVLYAASQFEALTIGNLPQQGTYDVQLITFPSGSMPKVSLGLYVDSDLKPLESIGDLPALVLCKTPSGWMPFGYYSGEDAIFITLQNLPLISEHIKSAPETSKTAARPEDLDYYVLENPYVQLVFTNVGGALAEINLPFETEQNQKSVVKEIGFDRQIEQDSPQNAHFPAHPYYKAGSKELQRSEQLGGYYPLLRRGIWKQNKESASKPQYYALNIVSDYPEMAELKFQVKEFTSDKIVFEALQSYRRIKKTYTLNNDVPYCFDLKIDIEGDSRGLWLSSGVPEVEIISNSSSPQIQYRLNRKGKAVVEKLDLPKVKEAVSVSAVHPDWVTNSNGYLGLILNPLTEIGAGYKALGLAGGEVPTRLSVIDPEYKPYPVSKYPGYQVLLPIPASGGEHHFRIFAGPFDESVLKAVDKVYSDPETGYNPDYIASWTFYGWFSFISEPFAKLLFVVMNFFHKITGSWGFSIILLTVFLRLMLYPLNGWSIKSMRRMQKLSPHIQAIQAKYKKEPKKAQMEIMALYREKKVNPFTGCIPILIQIPFLVAMFDLLKSSFRLRGASFIPGWINDLTAPDVLFQWKAPIFFIGNQFHLLPFLLGAVMFVQQRLSSTAPKDSSQMTDQQRQQRAMGTMMTLVFTVMFYHFPSGLNIYWLSSMLLGILQQWITNKYLDNKQEVEVEVLPVKKKSETKKEKSDKAFQKRI